MRRNAGNGWWLGGAGVGLWALVFAGWLGGGGHGVYVAAILLFPYTMGLAIALGGIGPALLALAVIQYPVYGALLGAASDRPRRTAMLRALTSLHLLAVLVTVVLAASKKGFWP
jgi:hypothetical protein